MIDLRNVHEALDRIAKNLRRAGADLPAPESKGTIESAMTTAFSVALCLVEQEREALSIIEADQPSPITPENYLLQMCEFDDLLEKYWGIGYSEGYCGLSRGSEANEVLHELRSRFRALLVKDEVEVLKHDIERSQDHAAELAKEPGWSGSQTSPSELWKNPLYSLQERLQMADGAVDFNRRVIENLRGQLAEKDAKQKPVAYMIRDCIGQREWSKWTPCSIEDYELRKEQTDIFEFRALVDAD